MIWEIIEGGVVASVYGSECLYPQYTLSLNKLTRKYRKEGGKGMKAEKEGAGAGHC